MAILLGSTCTLIVLYVPAYLVIIIRNTYDMLRTVTLGASVLTFFKEKFSDKIVPNRIILLFMNSFFFYTYA